MRIYRPATQEEKKQMSERMKVVWENKRQALLESKKHPKRFFPMKSNPHVILDWLKL